MMEPERAAATVLAAALSRATAAVAGVATGLPGPRAAVATVADGRRRIEAGALAADVGTIAVLVRRPAHRLPARAGGWKVIHVTSAPAGVALTRKGRVTGVVQLLGAVVADQRTQDDAATCPIQAAGSAAPEVGRLTAAGPVLTTGSGAALAAAGARLANLMAGSGRRTAAN